MSVIIRVHDNSQCPPATVIEIILTSLYFIAHNISSHEGIASRTNGYSFRDSLRFQCYYAFSKSTECIHKEVLFFIGELALKRLSNFVAICDHFRLAQAIIRFLAVMCFLAVS